MTMTSTALTCKPGNCSNSEAPKTEKRSLCKVYHGTRNVD